MNNINNSSFRNRAVTERGLDQAARALSVLLVHNPVAGWRRPDLLERVVEALRARGVAVVIRRTQAPGDAGRLARAALGEGFDRLLVAGGDGTVNEVATGLAGSALPLALIPMGTANVLATEIGLAAEPQAIVRAALDGPVARLALGMVRDRRFVMMAGIGFDAAVVREVDPAVKRRLGKLAYVLAALKLLRRYRPVDYSVTANGRRLIAGMLVLANGRHYGGDFVCAPAARLDQPTLELCLLRARNRLAILRYALALALGRVHRLGDVEILTTREALVEGPPGDPIQGDGDIIGALPARIAVAPETLLMAVPSDSPLLG